MKNILIPTDFSENSRNAINYAIQLCANWKCVFYILNVQKQSGFLLDDLMASPTNTSVKQSIVHDNEELLNELIVQLESQHSNSKIKFQPLFDFDSLTSSMNQIVKSKNIDLIIMGTNGATGAKEVVFGSNTLNVIKKVNCPVLTIPENYKFTAIESILFSTEDCKDFSEKGLLPLTQILLLFKADLSVLDLDFTDFSKSNNNKKYLVSVFNRKPFKYFSIKQVPTAMAISTITQLHNYNIHALFIESKSFFERLISGSITNEISYNSSIPLLILRK